jgi:inner membrane protein
VYIFGHVGITLGAVTLGAGAYSFLHAGHKNKDQKEILPHNRNYKHALSPASWLESLGRFIDIRFLIIGSIIPDIIDKPVGHLFFSNFFSNGRIFSHTLLFVVIILVLGIYLFLSRKQRWLLALGIGTAAHLMLDQMWLSPETFLWPFYGWIFPKFNEPNIIAYWVHGLETDPATYIPEIVGAAIVIAFAFYVVLWHKVLAFLKSGKV